MPTEVDGADHRHHEEGAQTPHQCPVQARPVRDDAGGSGNRDVQGGKCRNILHSIGVRRVAEHLQTLGPHGLLERTRGRLTEPAEVAWPFIDRAHGRQCVVDHHAKHPVD